MNHRKDCRKVVNKYSLWLREPFKWKTIMIPPIKENGTINWNFVVVLQFTK